MNHGQPSYRIFINETYRVIRIIHEFPRASRSRHNITTAAPMFIIESKHSTFTKYKTLIFIYLRIYIILCMYYCVSGGGVS